MILALHAAQSICSSQGICDSSSLCSAQRDKLLMSRSLLLSLLTYLLLLAGIVTVHGEFLALALPLVTYLLVGYLQAPEQIKLEATRHLSAERVSPDVGMSM